MLARVEPPPQIWYCNKSGKVAVQNQGFLALKSNIEQPNIAPSKNGKNICVRNREKPQTMRQKYCLR